MSSPSRARPVWFVGLLVIGLIGPAGCSSGESGTDGLDAEAQANALAEEFTDGVEFEDATVEPSAAPVSTAEQPQITEIVGPRSVGPLGSADAAAYGEWFELRLGAEAYEGVVGAVAFLQLANRDGRSVRHLVVRPPASALRADGLHLRARVRHVPLLIGNAARVHIAFLLADGRVGPYGQWNVVAGPASQEEELASDVFCACGELDGVSNVALVDPAACRDTTGGGTFESLVLGAPCPTWSACAGTIDPELRYPAGTVLMPGWAPYLYREECALRIACPGPRE